MANQSLLLTIISTIPSWTTTTGCAGHGGYQPTSLERQNCEAFNKLWRHNGIDDAFYIASLEEDCEESRKEKGTPWYRPLYTHTTSITQSPISTLLLHHKVLRSVLRARGYCRFALKKREQESYTYRELNTENSTEMKSKQKLESIVYIYTSSTCILETSKSSKALWWKVYYCRDLHIYRIKEQCLSYSRWPSSPWGDREMVNKILATFPQTPAGSIKWL